MIIPKMAIEEMIASEGIADTATVGLQTAGKVIDAAGSLGKAALTVKGTIGKSSITRMGRDSIMEFPAIFSAGIDTDDCIAIAKMLERYYASLMVSIFSLRPAVSLNEYSDIAEYIKSIHSNDAIPSNWKKAQHMAKEGLEDTSDIAEESLKEDLKEKLKAALKKISEKRYTFTVVSGSGEKKTDLHESKQATEKIIGELKNAINDMKALLIDNPSNSSDVHLNSWVKSHIASAEAALKKYENGLDYLKDVSPKLKEKNANLSFNSKEYHIGTSSREANNFNQVCKSNVAAIKRDYEYLKTIATESFSFDDDDEICLVNDAPSGLCVNGIAYPGEDIDLAYECWSIQGGALNSASINDIVVPYRRSKALLEERLAMATEGVVDRINETSHNISSGASRVISVGRNSNPTIREASDAKKVNTGAALNKDNGKIDMAPTMIDVTFYLHGSKKGANSTGANFTQSVKLGVKSMARVVSSEYIINNLVEGSKSSNPIFRFISWTRGEYKLVRDLIFNISEIKKKFKDKRKEEYGILQMSRDRKEVDDVTKFAGNRILPYLSLVVTDYEVAQTAQVTGVDLTNYRNAKAFMERYYLLAFGIYNSSTKTLSVLYDGANDFADMSMTYIQSEQKKSMDVSKNFSNLISIR